MKRTLGFAFSSWKDWERISLICVSRVSSLGFGREDGAMRLKSERS